MCARHEMARPGAPSFLEAFRSAIAPLNLSFSPKGEKGPWAAVNLAAHLSRILRRSGERVGPESVEIVGVVY
jgi:hypothetical protein